MVSFPRHPRRRTRAGCRSSRPPPETAAEQRLHIRAPVPGQAGLVANLRQPPAPRPRGYRRRGHPEQRRHLPAGHQVLTHAVAGHCRGGGFPRSRARFEHSQAGQMPALSRSSGSPAGRIKLTPGQCRSPSTAAPGQAPRRDTESPGVLLAIKVFLQLAARNIRQLTDIAPASGVTRCDQRDSQRYSCSMLKTGGFGRQLPLSPLWAGLSAAGLVPRVVEGECGVRKA